jgi:hypothetical protein
MQGSLHIQPKFNEPLKLYMSIASLRANVRYGSEMKEGFLD